MPKPKMTNCSRSALRAGPGSDLAKERKTPAKRQKQSNGTRAVLRKPEPHYLHGANCSRDLRSPTAVIDRRYSPARMDHRPKHPASEGLC